LNTLKPGAARVFPEISETAEIPVIIVASTESSARNWADSTSPWGIYNGRYLLLLEHHRGEFTRINPILIAHEFVHWVVDKVYQARRIPIFINEGLAHNFAWMLYDGRDNWTSSLSDRDWDAVANSDDPVPDLWIHYTQDQWTISSVSYLVNTYGADKLVQYLKTIRTDADAFTNAFGVTPDQFQQEYREEVKRIRALNGIFTPDETEEPGEEEPIGEEPEGEEPVGAEPGGDEEPGGGEPGAEEPVDEEPVGEEPVAEEPAGEETDEPATPQQPNPPPVIPVVPIVPLPPPAQPAVSPAEVVKAAEGEILVRAKTDGNGKAAVEIGGSAVESALSDAEAEKGLLHIQIQSGDAREIEVRLPAEQLLGALRTGAETVTVQSELAGISVSAVQLQSMIGADARQVILTVSKVDAGQLPSGVRERVGNRPVLEIAIGTEHGPVPAFESGSSVTVEIAYKLRPGENPHGIVVYRINDAGDMEIQKYAVYDSATGTIRFQPNHFSLFAVVHRIAVFSDLGGYDWAKNAVAALAARDIVTGREERKFHPGADITRAEFVQMLFRALELPVIPAGPRVFADAAPGAWYEQAVASAKALGIVQGKPDGTFGINDAITRQDAAVIMHRVGRMIRATDAPVGMPDYADANQIAGYAADAVAAMHAAGWMRGVGAGRFAPLQPITRAEAAVLIYNAVQSLMP